METNYLDRRPFNTNTDNEVNTRHSRLIELRGNPNLLVKELKAGHSNFESAKQLKEILDHIQKFPLGNYVPKTNIVFGEHEEGDERTFLVSEKIEGVNLGEVLEKNRLNQVLIEQLDNLLTENIRFYISTLTGEGVNKGGLSLDLTRAHFRENIMVGRKSGDKSDSDRIFAVDVYPILVYQMQSFYEENDNLVAMLQNQGIILPETNKEINHLRSLLPSA